jgi:hypothetical protein
MREIPLTQGKVALVDDEDFERINQHKWYLRKFKGRLYAERDTRPKRQKIKMHREVLRLKYGEDKIIDHRNHNGLDNRRCNLRICTNAENTHNQRAQTRQKTSKYKGVHWNKKDHRWHAQIKYNNKIYHLGTFIYEVDAAKIYDRRAIELFGDYACPNFPIENYRQIA